MPKVYNKRQPNIPKGAVYIGRGSPFGNPFRIGQDGDRDAVCEKYEDYLSGNPALLSKVKTELCGKNLVCWCAPKRCHGDFLLKIANCEKSETQKALGLYF